MVAGRVLLGAALLAAVPALAQTPVERAARDLERGIARDRVVEGADTASGLQQPAERGGGTGAVARVDQLDTDRRSLQPDVGRREERERLPDADRGAGSDTNVQR